MEEPSIPTLREDPKYRAHCNLQVPGGGEHIAKCHVAGYPVVCACNSSCVVIYQLRQSGGITYEALIVEEGLGGRLRLGGVWQFNNHALPPPPPNERGVVQRVP